ncbi:MAG TPA: hypothetical protein PLN52_06765 [Opitutaceae bacterium]|nr:hypothetical protein [Opitutaceae bacterium]
MSLTLATLLPGLVLLVLGVLFLIGNSAIVSAFKAMPRSKAATVIFFGGATAWFLLNLSTLSEADFGEYRRILMIAFALIALGAFVYVPDFLAVRGLAALMLLAAMPLLDAAYMEYDHPQRLFMVSAVFLGIAAAIYLGASPYRLRDFFGWLFTTPTRARALGGFLAGYGLLLAVVAFTY